MAVQSVASMVALVAWAASTPIQVRIVSVPVGFDTKGPFGIEFSGRGILVFVGTSLVAWVLWTIVTEHRIPRPRWPLRRKSDPFDPSLIGGLVATALTAFSWSHDLHGLLVVDDHIGAYVWAAPNDASYLISYLALFMVGVGISRIILTMRARRQRPTAPAPALPPEPSPS